MNASRRFVSNAKWCCYWRFNYSTVVLGRVEIAFYFLVINKLVSSSFFFFPTLQAFSRAVVIHRRAHARPHTCIIELVLHGQITQTEGATRMLAASVQACSLCQLRVTCRPSILLFKINYRPYFLRARARLRPIDSFVGVGQPRAGFLWPLKTDLTPRNICRRIRKGPVLTVLSGRDRVATEQTQTVVFCFFLILHIDEARKFFKNGAFLPH